MQAKTETPFAMPSLPIVAGGQKLLHAGVHLQAHALKVLMRYQLEALTFLKHRCEEDMKLMDDLAESEEFKDAFDILGAFYQNATTEYANEAGRIASIGSKLASETAQRLRKEADGVIEEMAAQTAA